MQLRSGRILVRTENNLNACAAKSSGGGSKARSSTKKRPGGKGARRRAKHKSQGSQAQAKPQAKSKVEFSSHAKKQLAELGLSTELRQEAERWHERAVEREMDHVGANHAEIRYIAHSAGSRDRKPHITALLRDKFGKKIKNDHGQLAHIYYDSNGIPFKAV